VVGRVVVEEPQTTDSPSTGRLCEPYLLSYWCGGTPDQNVPCDPCDRAP